VAARARTYAQTPVDLEGEGRPYGRRIAMDQESTDPQPRGVLAGWRRRRR